MRSFLARVGAVSDRPKTRIVVYSGGLVALLLLTFAIHWIGWLFWVIYIIGVFVTFNALGGGLGRALADRRHEQMVEMLPRRMQELGFDEESHTRILSVELMGGGMRMINVPAEYHPSQDGGELLMSLAVPELFGPGGKFDGKGFFDAQEIEEEDE